MNLNLHDNSKLVLLYIFESACVFFFPNLRIKFKLGCGIDLL